MPPDLQGCCLLRAISALAASDRRRARTSVVPNAGAVLLARTAEAVGFDAALSRALKPWRQPLARHDLSKIVLDLAIGLAVGGHCLADLGQLRTAPEAFGPVASNPAVPCALHHGDAAPTARLADLPADASSSSGSYPRVCLRHVDPSRRRPAGLHAPEPPMRQCTCQFSSPGERCRCPADVPRRPTRRMPATRCEERRPQRPLGDAMDFVLLFGRASIGRTRTACCDAGGAS